MAQNGVNFDNPKPYGGYSNYRDFANAVRAAKGGLPSIDTSKPYGGYNNYQGFSDAVRDIKSGTPATAPQMADNKQWLTGPYTTPQDQLRQPTTSFSRGYATPQDQLRQPPQQPRMGGALGGMNDLAAKVASALRSYAGPVHRYDGLKNAFTANKPGDYYRLREDAAMANKPGDYYTITNPNPSPHGGPGSIISQNGISIDTSKPYGGYSDYTDFINAIRQMQGLEPTYKQGY